MTSDKILSQISYHARKINAQSPENDVPWRLTSKYSLPIFMGLNIATAYIMYDFTKKVIINSR